MALHDYQTGELVHDALALTERLAGALADAAGETAEGTVLAAWSGGKWDYVSPRDEAATRARGEEVVIVFDPSAFTG